MFKKLKKYFVDNKWICLYRTVAEKDGLPHAQTGEWRKILCDARYWCADPFIVAQKDTYYVFCEMMDLKTSHGVLGLAKLGKESYARPIAELGCHVSYPNVFKHRENWYMVPETCARKTIELYRAVAFPYKWEKMGVLAENLHAVDTTVFSLQDKWYAFIYAPNGAENTLSIAELDVEQGCFGRVQAVKHYNSRIGRPAGNVFWQEGKLVRPTQYGVQTYGGKIVFKEFTFDPVSWKYEEHDVGELSSDAFCHVDGLPVLQGCHTYNRTGNIEIVDLKYQRFFFFKPLRSLLKQLRIGGYCFYGKK